MDTCIVYIGDFDLRNQNVQSHLVKNNGKIFRQLGYRMEYIGINRNHTSFDAVAALPPMTMDSADGYLELPDTLNIAGILKSRQITNTILQRLNTLQKEGGIAYVITYQSPTYATAIRAIARWCRAQNIPYIVNCADLPTFEMQSPLRRVVMKTNWDYLHRVNKRYANGVIAVSRYIADFYRKPGIASVIIPPLFDQIGHTMPTQCSDTPTFLYAGTPFKSTGAAVNPQGMKDRLDKVVDLFLTLSERGIPYTFTVVGMTKEEYLLGVPRHTVALESEKHIVFLGKHNHHDTLALVAAADFTINYRDENQMTKAGFSTKIVESVSVGTPVIINSISDTFLYLQDGRDGFVLQDNSVENIALLTRLCALSAEERLHLKQTLYEKNLFDCSKYAEAIKTFLHTLANHERNITT